MHEGLARKVNVRLPGKGNSNSHGARPVHLIITMIKWIRISRLSLKNSPSRCVGQVRFVKHERLQAIILEAAEQVRGGSRLSLSTQTILVNLVGLDYPCQLSRHQVRGDSRLRCVSSPKLTDLCHAPRGSS